MKLTLSSLSITKKISLLVALLFMFVGVSGYFLMTTYENRVIESQAISVAEIVARQAATARYFYGENAQKISHEIQQKMHEVSPDFQEKITSILTPARFLKGMAETASETSGGLYQYRAVSKWNIAQGQGLNNDFLKYAWAELEKQDLKNPDKAIDWKPVYRVQPFNGKDTLLYLRPDPAVAESCVNCHNVYEQKPEIIARRKQHAVPSGKQFKQHQLMGAVFVQIPVEAMQRVASTQSKLVISSILGMLTSGFDDIAGKEQGECD